MKLSVLSVALISLGFAPAQAVQLSKDDVTQIIAQAVTEATRINPQAIIAVTDREGFVLGVWDLQSRLPNPLPANPLEPPSSTRILGLLGGAITRAGTAAFLSSNEQAFTSRTAGYIIQQHFPVGVRNTPPGPLVGVGLSSLFFSDINRMKRIPVGFDFLDLHDPAAPLTNKRISTGVRGEPAPFGSLNDSPGGVPLYKEGQLVGGIGVTGDGVPTDLAPAAAFFLRETQRTVSSGFVATTKRDADEEVALAGQTGFRPSRDIIASNVLIGGIRIPYVQPHIDDVHDIEDVPPLESLPGSMVAGFPIQAPPLPYPYPIVNLGGVEGELRAAVVFDPALGRDVIRCIDDPVSRIPGREKIGKAKRLTAEEVESILAKAAQRASITRAGIRLPIGVSAKVFIAVVNNPQKNEEPPTVLGTFRTGEATLFSWDVAVQKARTAVFFSNRQLAMSARAVGFLAQRNFPPGLDGRPPGPLFGFQEAVSLKRDPVLNRRRPETLGFPGNPNLPNGLTIFPGGFPLYRDGQLIGAIGISGDGVDQDDIIGASGCEDFLPNARIRADRFSYRGARLPYTKFPRDPEK